jgi:putative ABC transport system permease protein
VSIREHHDITDPNKDDFAVNTMEEAAKMLSSVVEGLTLLLVALVCVSLLVGGVGIMNIMYVSVTERTYEIGLRKALGAKRRDVLMQFLFEAIILTVAGGIFGIICGALLALAIYFIAISYNYNWLYAVPFSSILLAISFSAAIGLLFGLYPAKKAASLDPIVALRKE